MRRFGRQFGMGEIAERAETVIDRYQNDPFFRQRRSVVGSSGSRSARQRAAVNPDHDRTFFVRLGRSPHIETETIFALLARGRVIDGALWVRRLRAIRPEVVAFANAFPRRWGLGSFPTQFARRRGGVRYPFVTANPVNDRARNQSALNTNDVVCGQGGPRYH